ncbi:adenylate/guanylate cyclase domain-containing protein [Mycobacterium sp. E2733]|uniref:ATP-binding protein n=1 Tax=Mycobacterium sp. E2733 TaxID=1834138 RepID=UPI001E3B123B|nr:adenylate/guanylate cyclase domain-containing protein [Mycobacterium sp. E2733]
MTDAQNEGMAGRGAGHAHAASVDELLDQAVAAINRGDRATASVLAERVLAVDVGNVEAEDLLSAPASGGEMCRLTLLFTDLVESTALSTRIDPETYRTIVGRYRDQVLAIVDRYGGHVSSTKGDGLFAVFGHPEAHENDDERAVLAGLEISREVAKLGGQAKRRFGVDIAVRVGVHRGLVYLDTAQDDVYGMAANLAQRVSSLAPPGGIVVSDAVAPLVGEAFELTSRTQVAVKGIEAPIGYYVVLGEQSDAGRVGVGRGPLVDRERELARLQNCWRRAQRGTLRTPGLVFRGEPGIGKSRLAAAAVELAESAGGVALELVGSPLHSDAGLHPVRTLLERRCGIARLTKPADRLRLLQAEVAARSLDTARMLPLLAPVIGIAPEAGYEPVAAEGHKLHQLIMGAVHEYLLGCFRDGSGLVVAKDVQWFDPSTLDVLGQLLGAADGRLLVVITGQDGGWLPQSWPVKIFDLKPLTDEQADILVSALNPRLSPKQRSQIRARCDGIPFYIEQLVRGFSDQPDGERTGIPDALYEPLFARLRASPNAVPVVEAAAVIGRQFDRGLLCSVCQRSGDEVDDVLDELEDALVVEPSGTNSWRFRHELLHEVARELAPASVRRGLHGKVADALLQGVRGVDPDWRLVAGHYEQAERFVDAISAYRQAATEARRRGALAEARTYLSLALTQLDRLSTGADRDRSEIAVRLERGFLAAAAEGNQSPAAVVDFERCLQLSGTDLHDDELLATMVALMVYYFTRADLRRVVRVLRSLRVGLEQGREWLRPVIEASFGVVATLRGEFNAASSRLEHAMPDLVAADQLDALWYQPNDPITTARVHRALVNFVRGDLPGAEAELAEVAGRVGGLGFPQGPFSAAFANFVEIWMRIEGGQLDQASVLAAGVTEQAQRHGFDAWHLWGETQQTTVAALTALRAEPLDPSALSRHMVTMTKLVDVLARAGLNAYLTFFDGVLAQLLLALGEPQHARDQLDAALSLARDTGMHFYDAELLRLRAHTHSNSSAVGADLQAALDLADRQGARLFELRVALDLFELNGGPSRAALAAAVSRMPTDSALPELARARAALTPTKHKAGG